MNPDDKQSHSQSISTVKPSEPVTSSGSGSSSSNNNNDNNDNKNNNNNSWLDRWCCMKTESGQMENTPDPYYEKEKQPPQEPLPAYSPQPPATQTTGSRPPIIAATIEQQASENQTR
ncbi:hypothetical protein Q8A73_000914 [Channa argus]|nr:hypothetical protein Q8A73_000914 [Channa argus]